MGAQKNDIIRLPYDKKLYKVLAVVNEYSVEAARIMPFTDELSIYREYVCRTNAKIIPYTGLRVKKAWLEEFLNNPRTRVDVKDSPRWRDILALHKKNDKLMVHMFTTTVGCYITFSGAIKCGPDCITLMGVNLV